MKRRRRSTFKKKKTIQYASQAGGIRNIKFRKRRISGRAYRRQLLRGSQWKAHYRSGLTTSSSIATQASSSTGTVSRADAMSYTATTEFFTVSGGAFQIDSGTPVPVFQDDIIIRGGTVSCALSNSNADTKFCKVWLMFTKGSADFSLIPTTGGLDFDPTRIPQFSKDTGTILMAREFSLENADTVKLDYRIRPQKIDRQATITNAGFRYQWLILVMNSVATAAENVTRTLSFSLAFSGDVVTPGS